MTAQVDPNALAAELQRMAGNHKTVAANWREGIADPFDLELATRLERDADTLLAAAEAIETLSRNQFVDANKMVPQSLRPRIEELLNRRNVCYISTDSSYESLLHASQAWRRDAEAILRELIEAK